MHQHLKSRPLICRDAQLSQVLQQAAAVLLAAVQDGKTQAPKAGH